jgi:hypothetical protein
VSISSPANDASIMSDVPMNKCNAQSSIERCLGTELPSVFNVWLRARAIASSDGFTQRYERFGCGWLADLSWQDRY